MIIKNFLTKYRRILSTHRAQVSLTTHLSTLECNRKIGEALRTKKPFFLGRLGWTEGDALGRFLTERSVPDKVKDPLCRVSGVFPLEDEELKEFSNIYVESLRHANILGWASSTPYQGWLIRSYAPQSLVADFHSIEPYFCEEPWSWSLQGLKVLVVHPFAESILTQYSTVRQKLFHNPKVLPEFSLKVIKAPQTINGHSTEYASWSKTLEALKKQVQQEDSDVAIIGCGAYGFPLAATVKEMGKVALHLGGVTQLLFGVRGRRWMVEQPKYHSIMTDAWCAPLEQERPSGWEKIEGGCYW